MAITNYDFDALDSNKKLYNAQEAIKRIADYKTQWNNANKSGDKATADSLAKKARVYYKMLIDNGYSDVASQLEKTNYAGANQIYDDFMKKNTVTPTTPETPKTGVDVVKSEMPEAVDTSSITGKINDLYGIQRSDRGTMAKNYDTLEDYNYNHNHYDSDIGKSIMANYKYQGDVASDNAVASGGASNSGNIDSYASANANRQQLAFTNAGNQAILNDFNARVNNARGILSDLGVYQQNQDKGMQTTIGLHHTEEQRKFDNDVKTSEVTGVVPKSMEYGNNPYLDENGNVIDPENTDFSLIEYNATEALKTEKDPQRRADLEQTIRWAKQARIKKTELPEWAKWRNTTTAVTPTETLPSKVTNKELDYNKYLTEEEIKANERISSEKNATDKYVADMDYEGKKNTNDAKEETWEDAIKQYNLSDNAKAILTLVAKDAWSNGEPLNVKLFLNTYKDKYNLTFADAVAIASMYNVNNDTKKWINEQTWYDPEDAV